MTKWNRNCFWKLERKSAASRQRSPGTVFSLQLSGRASPHVEVTPLIARDSEFASKIATVSFSRLGMPQIAWMKLIDRTLFITQAGLSSKFRDIKRLAHAPRIATSHSSAIIYTTLGRYSYWFSQL